MQTINNSHPHLTRTSDYFILTVVYVCCSRSFAKAVGCTMTSLKVCAKKKTVQEVLAAQTKIFAQPNLLTLAPVVDGYFLPGNESYKSQ